MMVSVSDPTKMNVFGMFENNDPETIVIPQGTLFNTQSRGSENLW